MTLTSRTCFALGIAAVLPQKDAGGAPVACWLCLCVLWLRLLLLSPVVLVGGRGRGGRRGRAGPALGGGVGAGCEVEPGGRAAARVGQAQPGFRIDELAVGRARPDLGGGAVAGVPVDVGAAGRAAAGDVQAAALGAQGLIGVGRPLLAGTAGAGAGVDRVALGVQRVLIGQAATVDAGDAARFGRAARWGSSCRPSRRRPRSPRSSTHRTRWRRSARCSCTPRPGSCRPSPGRR